MSITTSELQDGKIAVIELTAEAGKLNVIDDATLAAVAAHCQAADDNPAVRVVVLCASGRHFAVGASLHELQAKSRSDLLQDPRRDNWRKIAALSKPLVAAVQGAALGAGNELVMLCDLVFCDEQAQFGQPEINLGTIPGAGGTQRLARFGGKARTMQAVLTGRMFTAAEALQCGMVCAVCKRELLRETALAEAAKIAALSPAAVRAAKQCVLAAQELPLSKGLEFEYERFAALADGADRAEGIRAFLEKRAPVFTGE